MRPMPGENRSEKRTVTKEELEAKLARHHWKGLADFIAIIQDGDELEYQMERTPSQGFTRYVGRRKDSITYAIVISFFMS